MLNFHLPFQGYLTAAKLIPLWKLTKLWSFSFLSIVRQRVLTPSCKYLFFWTRDNLKIKRVLAISFVRLWSLTLLVVKLLVLFVIITTTVRKKMKLFPCFLAIKTLLRRVKRKEKKGYSTESHWTPLWKRTEILCRNFLLLIVGQ